MTKKQFEESRIVHQDTAPMNTASSVKRFWTKYTIPMLDYLVHSPYATFYDGYLFQKIKSEIKRESFQSIGSVKAKMTKTVNEQAEDFPFCFPR